MTPEAVPLALLVVVVLQLATAPLSGLISKRMEAEADWKALEVTRDPNGLEGVMVALSQSSLGDPDPPVWANLIFGTHPTPMKRIGMAVAFRSRESPVPGGS